MINTENELALENKKKTLIIQIKENIETLGIALLIALFVKYFFFSIFIIPSGSMIPTLLINDRIVAATSYYGVQNPLWDIKHLRNFIFNIENPLFHVNIPFSKAKYIYDFKSRPKRFQVVIFFPPEEPVDGPIHSYKDHNFSKITYFTEPQKIGSRYIKRIIGLPGEIVEVRDGYIYINGDKLNESNHLLLKDNDNFGPIKVSKNAYLCMGDNRGNSSDGRIWGFTPSDNILGRGLFRIWPLTRIGLIN